MKYLVKKDDKWVAKDFIDMLKWTEYREAAFQFDSRVHIMCFTMYFGVEDYEVDPLTYEQTQEQKVNLQDAGQDEPVFRQLEVLIKSKEYFCYFCKYAQKRHCVVFNVPLKHDDELGLQRRCEECINAEDAYDEALREY